MRTFKTQTASSAMIGVIVILGVAPARGLLGYNPAEVVPPLPAQIVASAVPMPAWLQEALNRSEVSSGCTNVLSLTAAYRESPSPGRAGRLELVFSNRLEQAVYLPRIGYPHDGGDGMLLLKVEHDGSRSLVPMPRVIEMRPYIETQAHSARTRSIALPAEFVNSVAGCAGLSVVYHNGAVKAPDGSVEVWTEAALLPVASHASNDPDPPAPSQWDAWLHHWSGTGRLPDLVSLLEDFPELAPLYPGVILDASLPEAFRLEFAARMPFVSGYNPALYDFIVNATDKDAPLVIAALKVLRGHGSATPEDAALRRTHMQALHAMSQDPQYPLRFRMHAAKLFRVGSRYDDFIARTEPMFKLLVADELRGVGGIDFPDADRLDFRAGLTAVLADNSPFEAGPMAGKYPENATVGQVAAIILADMEAMWAAEPYQPR